MPARRTWKLTGSIGLALTLNIAGCPSSATDEDTSIAGGTTGASSNNGGSTNGTGAGSGGAGSGGAGGSGAGQTTGGRVNPSSPTLFVTDKNGGFLSFKNPSTLRGDVAPATRIFGPFIIREGAVALSVDRGGDLMALSVDVGIAVFDNAETASGDLNPARRITGSATGLTFNSTFTINTGLIYDRDADRALACTAKSVLIWDNFTSLGAQANTPPTRTITSPDMTDLRSLALGPNGDLYVSAKTHVAVFANGATRTGNIRADRIIDVLDESAIVPGTTTTVDTVYVDRADRLYMFDTDPDEFIFVLDNAAAINGIVKPNRKFAVATPATTPGSLPPSFFPASIVIDAAGTGYVSDFGQDAIHVITNIGQRDGVIASEQRIVGPSTRFDEIQGIFLWE